MYLIDQKFQSDDKTSLVKLSGHKISKIVESNDNINKRIASIKLNRRNILLKVKELESEVDQMEFESYRDYFILNTFKRGKSVSGRVDTSNLKKYKKRVYYERISSKSNQDYDTCSSTGDVQTSLSSDNECVSTSGRQTRNQSNDSLNGVFSSPGPGNKKRDKGNLINMHPQFDISIESILPKETSSVRRSMRLTSKEHEKTKILYEVTSKDDTEAANINLYEVIVQKISNPVRHSDRVLPTKQKYVPEKRVPVKHVPEQVKINELVQNKRIQRILSRFEGGLAGVRTSKTQSS